MAETPLLPNMPGGSGSDDVSGSNHRVKSAIGALSLGNIVSQLKLAADYSKQLADNLTRAKSASGGIALGNAFKGSGSAVASNFAQGSFGTPPPNNSGGMRTTSGNGMMRFGFAVGALNSVMQPAVQGAVDRSYGIAQMSLAQGTSYDQAQKSFLGDYRNSGYGLTTGQRTQVLTNSSRMGLNNFGSRVYANLAGTSAQVNPFGNPEALGQGMMSPQAFYINRMFGTRLIDANGAPNAKSLQNFLQSGTGPGAVNLQRLLKETHGDRKRASQLIMQEFGNPNTMGHQMLVARFGGNEDAARSFTAYAAASAGSGHALDLSGKAMDKYFGKNYAGSMISKQQQAQAQLGSRAQDALMTEFNTKLQIQTKSMQLATFALGAFGAANLKVAAELTALATALGPLIAQLGLLKRLGGGVGGGPGAVAEAEAAAGKGGLFSRMGARLGASRLGASRLGRGILRGGGGISRMFGGPAGLLAFGASAGLDATGHHHLAGVASDAAYGAMIGSFVPGVGTGLGAGIGAAFGARNDIKHAASSGWHAIKSFFGDSGSAHDSGNPFEDRSGGETYSILEALANRGPNHIVTSTLRGSHASNSFHYSGNAVDFADKAGSSDSPGLLSIARWWAKNYGKSLSELIYSGGGGVYIKDGQAVGPSVYSGVLAEHHNHVHVAATKKGLAHGGGGVAGVPASNQDSSSGGGGVNTSGGGGVSGTGSIGASPGMSLGLAGGSSGGLSSLSSADIGSRIAASMIASPGGSPGGGGNGSVTSTGKVGVGRANTLGSSAPAAPGNISGNKALAKKMAASMGWGGAEWNALYAVWNQESSFNDKANNGVGYYGIPQGPIGQLRGLNAAQQIKWGLNYIKSRYGDPIGALNHKHATDSHLGSHAQYAQPGGWYKAGAYNINRDQIAMLHKGEMVLDANDAAVVRSGGGGSHHCPPINVDLDITVVKATDQEAERLAKMVVEKVQDKMMMERISGR